jgi:DNA-binding PadR family transcriptional regulator
MLRYLILELLRGGMAMHGYALVKAHEQRAGVAVPTGSVYRELRSLECAGLIRRVATPRGTDARRAPYVITDLGRADLGAWLAQPSDERAPRAADETAVRALCLFDGACAAPEAALEQMRVSLWMWGRRLERERLAAAAHSAGAPAGSPAALLPLLIERRLAHTAADLALVEKLTALTAPAARRAG